ncbi:hypothetical protein V6Z11_A02G123300 [Gossypium hirsutum]
MIAWICICTNFLGISLCCENMLKTLARSISETYVFTCIIELISLNPRIQSHSKGCGEAWMAIDSSFVRKQPPITIPRKISGSILCTLKCASAKATELTSIAHHTACIWSKKEEGNHGKLSLPISEHRRKLQLRIVPWLLDPLLRLTAQRLKV